jgi:6-phosphogluconolactonase
MKGSIWFKYMALPLLAFFFPVPGKAAGDTLLMYVGTYTGKGSEGIYLFKFDPGTGEVRSIGLAARTENPSFLAVDPNGRFLYAVNEIDSFQKQRAGAVSTFAISSESGKLKQLQQVSSLGGSPAHLSLDRSGRYVLVANYSGGNVAVFPISPDGRLGKETAIMQAHGSSVNKARQEAPHAHFIQTTPDNRLALVADLGIDKLLAYDFDDMTGTLRLDSAKVRTVDPGAGPRHVAMVPSGRHVYVVNELNSTVTHFSCQAEPECLEAKETVSTLPPGFSGANTTAEIIVDAQGKFLYVSNRGDDSIVQFGIDAADGSLRLIDRFPCGGKSPRNIALDPTGRWLFSANQNSNTITLFQVNPADGRLTAVPKPVKVSTPVCVTFVRNHK